MIVAAIVLAAVACWITSARALYARWRPSSLPVGCTTPSTCYQGHQYPSCYARVPMIDTVTEASVFALLAGLLWPVLLPLLGVAFLIRFRQPQTREELAARIAELEREAGIR